MEQKRIFIPERNRWLIRVGVVLIVIAVIYAALVPLYLYVSSDVENGSVLPTLLYYAMFFVNGAFLWAVPFCLTLAFCSFGSKNGLRFFWVSLIAVAVLRGGSVGATVLVSPPDDFLWTVFPSLLVDVSLDLVLFGGSAIVLIFFLKKKSNGLPVISSSYPMNGLLDRKNPMLCAFLAVAGYYAAFRVADRLLLDLSIGAPSSVPDFLWMLTSYVSDLLGAVFFYLISVLVVEYILSRTPMKTVTE